MDGHRSYGVLGQASPDTLEFTVAGMVQRGWTVRPPETMSQLLQRCLTNLGHEGWRPISHQPNVGEAVVLARVPYPAGTKLAVFGTLRFVERDDLVLTVSGAAMQRWSACSDRAQTLAAAESDLARQGWRIHRRYLSGATVVRG